MYQVLLIAMILLLSFAFVALSVRQFMAFVYHVDWVIQMAYGAMLVGTAVLLAVFVMLLQRELTIT